MNLEIDFELLFNQRRFSEIITKSNSVGINPATQPSIARYIAAAYFSLGDYNSSEKILVQLEPSCSDNASFLSLYAATSRRLSNFNKAELLFQQALSIDPNSLSIQNNYANLLIDQSKFDHARQLLESILQIDPSYVDAQENLKRLIVLSDSSSSNQPSSSFVFQDPLLFAFEEQEVNHSLKRYKMSNKNISSSQTDLLSLPNSPERNVALEQITASRRALQENQIKLSLSLCSQAFKILGPNSLIFDLLSDIHLNQRRFVDAELFLLHSVALDGLTLKRCFNLASFSLMKSNLALANFYYEKASSIDPSAPDLSNLKTQIANSSTKIGSRIYDFAAH